MFRREESTKDKVLILLAPQFDEVDTVYCLKELRKASFSVCLVGMSSGLVKGMYGLIIRPDYSLDELRPEQPIRLILIPGGQACSASILSDPRAHRLLDATLRNFNFVAAMTTAEPILHQAGFEYSPENHTFLGQGGQTIELFADLLIHLISKPQNVELPV